MLPFFAGEARSAWDIDDETLAGAAALSSRFFGTAVRHSHLLADHAYAELVIRHCSSLTPEIELKWAAVETERGALSLTAVDDIAAFARRHGKRVHGHTLLWDQSVPRWAIDSLLAGDWTPLHLYISSIVPRLGDVVDYWDVVNEPILTGYRADGLRPNIFLKGFGPDYIRRALETARTFQPGAKLLINEYGLEYDFEVEDHRRYHFLRLIERLRRADVPLDGVGLQAHLDLRKGTIAKSKLSKFLDDLVQMDLEIVITEFDVHEASYIAPAEVRDQKVADEARRYLDIVLQQSAVKGLSTWGLSDRYSWLDIANVDLTTYENAWTDGTGPGLNRGLPFDTDLRPKPMYQAILEMLLRK
jgi:endo-1,4-beta-xylanase